MPTTGGEARPPSETPYLHVRPPRRVGVGEGHQDAKIVGNRAGLLRLRDQIDHALGLEHGLGAMLWNGYEEIDGRVFGLMVHRATRPGEMGEAREPDPPDYSMFA